MVGGVSNSELCGVRCSDGGDQPHASSEADHLNGYGTYNYTRGSLWLARSSSCGMLSPHTPTCHLHPCTRPWPLKPADAIQSGPHTTRTLGLCLCARYGTAPPFSLTPCTDVAAGKLGSCGAVAFDTLMTYNSDNGTLIGTIVDISSNVRSWHVWIPGACASGH